MLKSAARISMAVGLIGAAGAALTGLRDYSRLGTDPAMKWLPHMDLAMPWPRAWSRPVLQ